MLKYLKPLKYKCLLGGERDKSRRQVREKVGFFMDRVFYSDVKINNEFFNHFIPQLSIFIEAVILHLFKF